MVLVRGSDPEAFFDMTMCLSDFRYNRSLHLRGPNLHEISPMALAALPRMRPIMFVHRNLQTQRTIGPDILRIQCNNLRAESSQVSGTARPR